MTKSPFYATVITAVFGVLAIILKDKNTVLSVILFLLSLVFVYFIVRAYRKEGSTQQVTLVPEKHPIFNIFNNIIIYDLPRLKIENKLKKYIIIMYLEHKLRTLDEVLRTSIKFNNVEYISEQLNCLSTTIKHKMLGHAPDIFFHKMLKWDLINREWAHETIDNIIASSYYTTTEQKYIAIFDCLQAMIRASIANSEKALNELNGSLERELNEMKGNKGE